MAPAEPRAQLLLCVEVVYCPAPGHADRVSLALPAGATVQQALHASGVLERHALDPASLHVGVWCRSCDGDRVLRDRDRVEVYRGLTVDPKEARRLRYRRRGHREAAAG